MIYVYDDMGWKNYKDLFYIYTDLKISTSIRYILKLSNQKMNITISH